MLNKSFNFDPERVKISLVTSTYTGFLYLGHPLYLSSLTFFLKFSTLNFDTYKKV